MARILPYLCGRDFPRISSRINSSIELGITLLGPAEELGVSHARSGIPHSQFRTVGPVDELYSDSLLPVVCVPSADPD